MILKITFFFFAFIAALPAQAQETVFPSENYASNAQVPTVEQIIDYKTLLLSDQTVVTLSGLYVPEISQETAFNWLQQTLMEQAVKTYRPARKQEKPKNRFGHNITQLVTADQPQIWVQAAMLSQGFALFWPNEYITDPETTERSKQAERQARDLKAGLWSENQNFEVIEASDDLPPDAFAMQIVKGAVRSVSTVSGNTYLNFGENWRRDFTVMIPSTVRRQMSRNGLEPTQLQGNTIEVRGYIESYYGPMIKLHHPAQISVIED